LKLNCTNQLLVYADDNNILGGSVHTIKEKAKAFLVASKGTGLEVNADKSKSSSVYTFLYYSYSVYSQINVYITLHDKIYITLYLDEIPPDHISWRWMFFGTFHTEQKELLSFAWNCHYCTVLISQYCVIDTYQFLYILEF